MQNRSLKKNILTFVNMQFKGRESQKITVINAKLCTFWDSSTETCLATVTSFLGVDSSTGGATFPVQILQLRSNTCSLCCPVVSTITSEDSGLFSSSCEASGFFSLPTPLSYKRRLKLKGI